MMAKTTSMNIRIGPKLKVKQRGRRILFLFKLIGKTKISVPWWNN